MMRPIPTRQQLLWAADSLKDQYDVGIPSVHFGKGIITIAQYCNPHGHTLNPETDPLHWVEADITYAMALKMLGVPLEEYPE